jgi:hypothetical protein
LAQKFLRDAELGPAIVGTQVTGLPQTALNVQDRPSGRSGEITFYSMLFLVSSVLEVPSHGLWADARAAWRQGAHCGVAFIWPQSKQR